MFHSCKFSFASHFRQPLSKENLLVCHYLKSHATVDSRMTVTVVEGKVYHGDDDTYLLKQLRLWYSHICAEKGR